MCNCLFRHNYYRCHCISLHTMSTNVSIVYAFLGLTLAATSAAVVVISEV